VSGLLHQLNDFGLFDPAILAVSAAIAVACFAWSIRPIRRHSNIAPERISSKDTVGAGVRAAPENPVCVNVDSASQLDRLVRIIEDATALSTRVSAAHSGATVKIDAAEHALNRMLQDIKGLLPEYVAAKASVATQTPALLQQSSSTIASEKLAA
jgi:hypothetical protein